MSRLALAAALGFAVTGMITTADAQERRRPTDITVRPSGSWLSTPKVALPGEYRSSRPDIRFESTVPIGYFASTGGSGPNGLLPDRFAAGTGFVVDCSAPWAR